MSTPTVRITPSLLQLDFIYNDTNFLYVRSEDYVGDTNLDDLAFQNINVNDVVRIHRRGAIEVIRDTTVTSSNNGVLMVKSGSTTLMQVDKFANMSIGTASPLSKFHLISDNTWSATGWGVLGRGFRAASTTLTDADTIAGSTVTNIVGHSFDAVDFVASLGTSISPVTYTNAIGVYFANPTVGTNTQAANYYAAWFNGNVNITGTLTIATLSPTTLTLGGDVTGNYSSNSVVKINGVALGSTAATSGNVLIGSGTQWVSNTISGAATLNSSGVMTLTNSGVAAGSYNNVTVSSKGVITAASNSGIVNQVAYYSGTNILTGSSDYTFNESTGTLAVPTQINLGGFPFAWVDVVHNDIFIGNSTLSGTINFGYAVGNILIGNNTGQYFTTAAYNTHIGITAGQTTTTAEFNTLVGNSAGTRITTGSWNTIIGSGSGYAIRVGHDNIILGYNTSTSSDNSYTIVIGNNASSPYDKSVVIGYDAISTASNQFVIGSDGDGNINNVYIGSGAVSATPLAVTINATGGSGTNIAAANLILAAGTSTGNATPGVLYFATSTVGSSGTTLQTLYNRGSVDGLGNLNWGASSQFILNSSGNIVLLNNVTTNFPSTQGAASSLLQNDGSGNLTWATGILTTTLASGDIFVGNSSNIATGVAMSGEASITNTGAITLLNSAVTGKLLTGLSISGSTISATDSILIAFGKVQNQINGLVGGIIFKGLWNATTNTPTLTSGVGTTGWLYKVSVAGAASPPVTIDGISQWNVGDELYFDGTVWNKLDGIANEVISFNTRTGPITLLSSDVTTALGYTPITNVLTSASIIVGNSSNVATAVALSGDATISNVGVITIGNNVVNYAKFQQVSASSFLGNPTGSTANVSEITLGAGLSFSGTTLVNSVAGAVTSIGTFDSQTSNAKGAVIITNVIYFQSATASNPGMVNTTSQTFAGTKTTTIWNASTQFNIGGSFFATQDNVNTSLYISSNVPSSATAGLTIVGYGAGNTSLTGINNTIIGTAAGNIITSGAHNVIIGYGTDQVGTTGSYKVIIGDSANAAFAASASLIAIGYGVTADSNQGVFGSTNGNGITAFYFGKGFTSATPYANVSINSTNGVGSNIVASNLLINGGASTGNATPASIIFKTSTATTSGGTPQTLAERARIDGATGYFEVGSSQQFQVNTTGNIILLNNVTTNFPSSQGGSATLLNNDGSGNLTWVVPILVGDVTGNYNANSVVKINGAALGTTTATSGNVLIGSGTQWVSNAISGAATLNSSGTLTLATSGVTAGSYNNVTVNNKGLITSASNSGTVNQIAYYSGTNVLAGTANFGFDGSNFYFGVSSASARFHIVNTNSSASFATSTLLGQGFRAAAYTLTDSSTTGTKTNMVGNSFDAVTFVANASLTVTNLYGNYFASPTMTTGTATNIYTIGIAGNIAFTGLGTSGGNLYISNSTGQVSVSAAGSTGQILQSGGTGAPTWSTPTYPSTSGTNLTMLMSNGTNVVYSTPTYANSYTASAILYASSSNTVVGASNFGYDGSNFFFGISSASARFHIVPSNTSVTFASSLLGLGVRVAASSFTSSSGIAYTNVVANSFDAPNFTATSSTVTNLYNVYIAAPTITTATATNLYALGVGGNLNVTGVLTLGTVLSLANGGTNANLTASNGGIVWSNASQLQILSGTATAGLALISGASATPQWYAPTATQIIYAGTNGILASTTNFVYTSTGLGVGLSSPSAMLHIVATASYAAWGVTGVALRSAASTLTDNSSAAGTVASVVANSFGVPTFATTTNTVTYTDSATAYFTLPAAGSHVTLTNTWAIWSVGGIRIDGGQTIGAWGLNGRTLNATAATLTDSSSAAGTVASVVSSSFSAPTFATVTNAVTYTNAANLYLAQPIAGSHVTFTNAYALWNAGAELNSFAGVASQNAFTISGTPYSAGTSTTNFPQLMIQDATASTTWSGSGTYIGINANKSSAMGIDVQYAGVSKFNVNKNNVNGNDQSWSIVQTANASMTGITWGTLGILFNVGNINGYYINDTAGVGTYALTAMNSFQNVSIHNNGATYTDLANVFIDTVSASGSTIATNKWSLITNGAIKCLAGLYVTNTTQSLNQSINTTNGYLANFASPITYLTGFSASTNQIVASVSIGGAFISAHVGGNWNLSSGTSIYAGLPAGAGATVLLNKWGLYSDGSILIARPAQANTYSGNLSIGDGAWGGGLDGVASNYFVGSAAGTQIAINAASGSTADLLNFQIAGVSKFAMASTGYLKNTLTLVAGTTTVQPLLFQLGTNLTTAIGGSIEYNDNFYLTKNNNVRYAVGGVLIDHASSTGVGSAAGAGSTNLFTDSIPANTLDVNNAKICAVYSGSFVNNVDTKQLSVTFGGSGNVLVNTGTLVSSGAGYWWIEIFIIRVSSSVVNYSANVTITGSSTLSTVVGEGQFSGLTLTSANNLVLIGTVGGAGTINDILAMSGYVEYKAPAGL